MLEFKRLATLFTLVAVLAAPAAAKSRKGEKFLAQGNEAAARRQWETALDFYEQAMLEDPSDAAYQLATRKARFHAASFRVAEGNKLRAAGKLEEALGEFQRAYAIDPSSAIAEQELLRTRQMIERERKPDTRSATQEERGLTPAERVQKEAEEKASRMLPIPELKPLQRQISTLRMNNQPVKVLFETVGKLAGINVIFDAEYQNPQGKSTFTVDLSNTSLEEALDYLAVQTKSYWKPLSTNTIFITNDNVTKRRDYEDYVVKVFYVKNATTVQELQEISTTVRSVTEIRRAFTYNSQFAILVRGTADQVALAEKLIQDLDKPKAEIVIDVVVMEANRGRVRDLAATITTAGAPGINVPISYNGGTPSAPSGDDDTPPPLPTIPLNKLGSLGLGDFSIAVPGVLLQALMSDSQTRILQNPQVRAVDNFKASLKIGDRIPYATGSFQPGVGGVGLNPLVSTQFNFLDTGVNVDVTPRLTGDTEVSMHIEVDLSAKSGEVDLGGIRQPSVSRRTIVQDIRVKEGEVSLLGGLLGTQEIRTRGGIPYLMDIPYLGRLFGSEKLERSRNELLVALIPRVVRKPIYSESNLKGVSAGNDQNVKLNYALRSDPPAAPVQQPPAAASPAAPAAPPAAAAVPVLSFVPGTLQAAVNTRISVALQLDNVNSLFAAPMRLRFDPKLLRFDSVQAGTLLTGDGQKVNLNVEAMNETGELVITLNRLPGSGGVTGSGALLQLTFQTLAPGTAAISVVDPQFRNTQLELISVVAPAVSVVVQ